MRNESNAFWSGISIGIIVGGLLMFMFYPEAKHKKASDNVTISVNACIEQGGIPIIYQSVLDDSESFDRCQFRASFER